VIRYIALTSTDGISPIDFDAVAVDGATNPWLFVAPNLGTTPQSLTVLIDPIGITAGTYTGIIRIGPGVSSASDVSSAGIPIPISIPITLTVK